MRGNGDNDNRVANPMYESAEGLVATSRAPTDTLPPLPETQTEGEPVDGSEANPQYAAVVDVDASEEQFYDCENRGETDGGESEDEPAIDDRAAITQDEESAESNAADTDALLSRSETAEVQNRGAGVPGDSVPASTAALEPGNADAGLDALEAWWNKDGYIQYVETLGDQSNNAFLGADTVFAFSRVFQVNIRIQGHENNNATEIVEGWPSLKLKYNGENHYDAIVTNAEGKDETRAISGAGNNCLAAAFGEALFSALYERDGLAGISSTAKIDPEKRTIDVMNGLLKSQPKVKDQVDQLERYEGSFDELQLLEPLERQWRLGLMMRAMAANGMRDPAIESGIKPNLLEQLKALYRDGDAQQASNETFAGMRFITDKIQQIKSPHPAPKPESENDGKRSEARKKFIKNAFTTSRPLVEGASNLPKWYVESSSGSGSAKQEPLEYLYQVDEQAIICTDGVKLKVDIIPQQRSSYNDTVTASSKPPQVQDHFSITAEYDNAKQAGSSSSFSDEQIKNNKLMHIARAYVAAFIRQDLPLSINLHSIGAWTSEEVTEAFKAAGFTLIQLKGEEKHCETSGAHASSPEPENEKKQGPTNRVKGLSRKAALATVATVATVGTVGTVAVLSAGDTQEPSGSSATDGVVDAENTNEQSLDSASNSAEDGGLEGSLYDNSTVASGSLSGENNLRVAERDADTGNTASDLGQVSSRGVNERDAAGAENDGVSSAGTSLFATGRDANAQQSLLGNDRPNWQNWQNRTASLDVCEEVQLPDNSTSEAPPWADESSCMQDGYKQPGLGDQALALGMAGASLFCTGALAAASCALPVALEQITQVFNNSGT